MGIALQERPLRVAIIGAGIGGLTAARALRRLGMDAQVYEQASALGEVGAGVQLGPNAVKVLAALGLEDAVHEWTSEPVDRVNLNYDDAALLFREPMKARYPGLYGAPYRTIHRARLHKILVNALPEDVVHLKKRCIQIASNHDSAVAQFEDGTKVEADVVIGADGIRSNVRGLLFGVDEPRFTRSVAWRAVIDIAHAPELVGPEKSVALNRHDHVSWFGPNGQVICYPIENGSLLNIFAGHASEEWVEESWSVRSSREDLLEAYSGWNDALLGMFEKVEQCYKWGIFDRDPIPEWTVGRIGLLGDAAHPTMPNLAQGANMAIEDGFVLARNLAAGGAEPEAALTRYAAERQARTSRITLQSRVMFENTMKVPPAPPMDRSWIYSFDATS